MVCDLCGQSAPTRKTTLYRNIGMIVVARHTTLKGDFCHACIRHYFWEYMLVTGALGWWGVISFFLTPLMLIANVIQWVASFRLVQNTSSAFVTAGSLQATALPQCPRCQAHHPVAQGLNRAIWTSLIVTALLSIWAAYLIVFLFQQQSSAANWGAVLFFLGIISFTLFNFVMLLRNPLSRCTQCGNVWPTTSS